MGDNHSQFGTLVSYESTCVGLLELELLFYTRRHRARENMDSRSTLGDIRTIQGKLVPEQGTKRKSSVHSPLKQDADFIVLSFIVALRGVIVELVPPSMYSLKKTRSNASH